MLGGHAEALLAAIVPLIFVLKDLRLFKHLSRIAKKNLTLYRRTYPLVRPIEYIYPHLFFQLMDGICQARLGYIQSVSRLSDRARISNHHHISKLLKCHDLTCFLLLFS